MQSEMSSAPPPADVPPKIDGRGIHKRNSAQRDNDRLLIERWHLSGKPVPVIREMLAQQRPYKLSESQIYQDIRKLQMVWRQEALTERQTAIGETLRSLRRQEEELWEAWEKSKTSSTRTTLSKTNAGKDSANRETKTAVQESSHGDPAYMRMILDIHKERAALLGLYAPTKAEVSGPGGGPIQVSGPLTEETQHAILERHFERMKRVQPTTDANTARIPADAIDVASSAPAASDSTPALTA